MTVDEVEAEVLAVYRGGKIDLEEFVQCQRVIMEMRAMALRPYPGASLLAGIDVN